MITPAFPLTAPFRIDQFMVAPQAMTALFFVQGGLAIAIHWAGVQGRTKLWRAAVALLLLLILVFFTLGSWGTSDTTRFSHYLEWDPDRAPPELLWRLLRPLLLWLPYRMAMVHGLEVSGYAAAAILLSSLWRARPWAGWWALVLTCSPMLRGFMQNAHSRQALALLLLLPLLLHGARLVRLDRRWLVLGTLLSALSHNTFVLNLPISLLPWLQRLPELSTAMRDRFARLRWHDLRHRWPDLRRRWPVVLALLVLLALFMIVAPIAWGRLQDYSQDEYFNQYPLTRRVGRLQWALAFGLLLACLQRRLDPRQLLACPLTQMLAVFGLLYIGIQQSIIYLWLPQVTCRVADGVALFLLIFYFAWLDRYRAHWCLLPVMYMTFQYWLEGRLLVSGALECGLDDNFLCLPDRWPWQVRY
jgi:hypothetical protein